MPSKHVGSFRIQVFSNDHRPAHVHVFQDDMEIVLELNDRKAVLRETRGKVPSKVIAKAKKAVEDNFEAVSEMWENIHGT